MNSCIKRCFSGHSIYPYPWYASLLALNLFAIVEAAPDEEIIELIGIKTSLEQLKVYEVKAVENRVEILREEFKSTLQRLTPDQQKQVNTSLNKLIQSGLNSWTIEEASRIYIEVWRKYYPAEKLDIIEDSIDPETQKLIKVALEAQLQINNYIQNRYDDATEEALRKTLGIIKNLNN